MTMRAKYAMMAVLLSMTLLPGRVLFAQVAPAAAGADTDHIVAFYNSNYVVLDIATGARTILPGVRDGRSPVWSPDGTRILFVVYSEVGGPTDLLMINADGTNLRRYSDSPDYQPIPSGKTIYTAWSPNGAKLAILITDNSTPGCIDSKLEVVGADFHQPQTLYTWPDCASELDWSPDGKSLALAKSVNGHNPLNVFVVAADGSSARQITFGGASEARWSPDGTRLAYIEPTTSPGGWDIFLISPNGSDRKRLTFNGGLYPDWSPDGSLITFAALGRVAPDGHASNNIFVVNADGSNLRNVTNSFENEAWPAWSPDGTRIAFQRSLSGDFTFIELNGERRTSIVVQPQGFDPWQPRPNVLSNPGFEVGSYYWHFQTNGQASFAVAGPGFNSANAGKVTVTKPASQIQLFEKGFRLEPNTKYRLRFSAYSNRGHDLSLYLHNHSTGTNYGLSNFKVNLTTGWKKFTVDFTSKGFTTLTTDTRLRFWFGPYAKAGDNYFIDTVSLEKLPASAAAAVSSQAGSINGRVATELMAARPATVSLTDMESEGAALYLTTQPDAGGAFQFDNLPYGNYEVSLQPAPGQTAPEAVQLAVSDEANEEIFFGPDVYPEGEAGEPASQLFLPLIVR